MQSQEVRGAGDAGVIVADSLLALPGQLLFRYIFVLLDIAPEIMFNRLLVQAPG